MGITQKSIERLNRHNCLSNVKMCELGAQNIYEDGDYYGTIAKHYLQRYGVEHSSYDILVHQECEFIDLRKPIANDLKGLFDVVTDFGTTEHVEGNYYEANKNIHDMCKVGGLIIRENPLTGNWIGHGHNYLDEKFYIDLASKNNYEILELCIEAAMGNFVDGNNVCVVLRKTSESEFMSEKEFSKLTVHTS
jgi:hypothetical protein